MSVCLSVYYDLSNESFFFNHGCLCILSSPFFFESTPSTPLMLGFWFDLNEWMGDCEAAQSLIFNLCMLWLARVLNDYSYYSILWTNWPSYYFISCGLLRSKMDRTYIWLDTSTRKSIGRKDSMNLPVDNIMHHSLAPRVLSIVQYKQIHLNACLSCPDNNHSHRRRIHQWDRKKKREKRKRKEKGKGSSKNTGLYMLEKKDKKEMKRKKK